MFVLMQLLGGVLAVGAVRLLYPTAAMPAAESTTPAAAGRTEH